MSETAAKHGSLGEMPVTSLFESVALGSYEA